MAWTWKASPVRERKLRSSKILRKEKRHDQCPSDLGVTQDKEALSCLRDELCAHATSAVAIRVFASNDVST
jgi:hypothetical protein